MIDTHCHLNFSRFKKNIEEVIGRAKQNGVNTMIVPGTDVETSYKALEIAKAHEGVYAAVGIHPHHVLSSNGKRLTSNTIEALEKLLQEDKVVAVGEIGMDKHVYRNTKYENYVIDEKFINLQKELLLEQLKLAAKYKKAVILHNWEAKTEILDILTNNYYLISDISLVFHCCEPDHELLQFAKEHGIFIGVDGDVTYSKEKQEFIKQVPLEMLVLETDSPYLLPEPLRSQKLYPNEPKNIVVIAEFLSKLLNTSIKHLIKVTTKNAERLFGFQTYSTDTGTVL